MQALKCFSVLAFENPQVSMTLVNGECSAAAAAAGLALTFCLAQWEWLGALSLFAVSVDGELLPQIFVKMLQRDKPIEMQLTSAKW